METKMTAHVEIATSWMCVDFSVIYLNHPYLKQSLPIYFNKFQNRNLELKNVKNIMKNWVLGSLRNFHIYKGL